MDTTLNTQFSKPTSIARPCPVWLLITFTIVGGLFNLLFIGVNVCYLCEVYPNLQIVDGDPGIQNFFMLFLPSAAVYLMFWAVREGLRHECPSLSLVSRLVLVAFIVESLTGASSLLTAFYLPDGVRVVGIIGVSIYWLNQIFFSVLLFILGLKVMRKFGGVTCFLGVLFLIWGVMVFLFTTWQVLNFFEVIEPSTSMQISSVLGILNNLVHIAWFIVALLSFRRPTPADFMMRPGRAWAFVMLACAVVYSVLFVVAQNYRNAIYAEYYHYHYDYDYDSDYDSDSDYDYNDYDDDYYGDTVAVDEVEIDSAVSDDYYDYSYDDGGYEEPAEDYDYDEYLAE